MNWTLDFLRNMNVPQKVLLLFKRAQCMTIRHRHKNWKTTSNFAWIGKTRFLTGTGRRGRRAAADSAARQRLVLTSCRQGRLTGLGLLTLQKRWSTKLQSHLKNSNNVKTASQKNLWYDHTYLHKLFIPGHYVWSFFQYVKESKIISIFSPSSLSLDDLTYFL